MNKVYWAIIQNLGEREYIEPSMTVVVNFSPSLLSPVFTPIPNLKTKKGEKLICLMFYGRFLTSRAINAPTTAIAIIIAIVDPKT